MTTIEYLNEKIEVPTRWEEITLRNYENFYKERPEGTREKVALLLKICKADPAKVMKWPAEVFHHIVEQTYFLWQEYTVDPSPSVVINGKTFVIPIEEKLSFGAYVDADEAQKSETNVLSQVLAITCRPAGEEYDPELTEERAEMFGALSMAEVQPLLNFFLHCNEELERRTRVFGNLILAVESLPRSTQLLRNLGSGIKWSQMWRIIKYGCLTLLLRFHLRKFLRMSNTQEIKVKQIGRKGF